jgi:DNA ligase-1
LGDIAGWQIEWKWDGIRAQLIRRDGHTYIWSRGEDLMTERFPDLTSSADALPDGLVLDGEILAWRDQQVLPFNLLQKRIGRKHLSPKILCDAPVVFMAFDLLERDGQDIRMLPLRERREMLERQIAALEPASRLRVSPLVNAAGWRPLTEIRATSRQRNTEGLMLKRRLSTYGVGRKRGDWWKWKIDPYTVDAVLIYAQRGSGRRASLYTDYTFAVWHEGELVSFAKAYSGLDDAEIRQVDAFVRRNTLERFGPVRRVKPELVFELAFENIQRSSRHKSGIAVRFPRIARWRKDKSIDDADSLDSVKALLVPPDQE